MKAGWRVVPLGEVCTLQRGFDLPTAQRVPGRFPLVTSSGPTDTHDEAKVKGPGVVTGRSGSIGNVFFVEKDFWPLNTALYVKDFHGNDPKFVWYLLQFFDLSRFSSGTGVPTLNRNDVHGEAVSVPISTDEQKRIVAVLDEAFEGLSRARANAEANLADGRELFEAHLDALVAEQVDRFGTISVSELSEEVTDGDHQPPPKAQDGIPFITISNVDKETRQIDFRDTFKVPRAYFAELKDKRKPRSGDVLYTVTGSFGIPILIADDREFCFQRHIALVRPKREISSRWLAFMLMSGFAFKQADEGATGTAQRTVSLKVLRAIQLPQTPPNEQRRFADELTTLLGDCRSLFDRYRKSIGEVDALRHSLLQKAFSGELTR